MKSRTWNGFPALELARRAGEIGGTLPAVLNAANEVAVEAFVNRKINFPQITETVRRTMDAHQVVSHPTLEQILEADAWARRDGGNLKWRKDCGLLSTAILFHG